METAALQDRPEGTFLKGKTVALTGRLAALTRAAAARLIRASGGCCARSVTRRTDLLVIGQQGWPLRPDGRLARNLQKAQWLQSNGAPLEVICEDEFLQRLGLQGSRGEIHRRHTLNELSRIAGIPAPRIRTWIRAGLLQAAEEYHDIQYFDFRQASILRTLDQIARAGVSTARLRRSLEQLRCWMPDADQVIVRLNLLDGTRRIIVRSDDGRLLEASGQQLLDFGQPVEDASVVPFEPDVSADELFQRALELEERGRPAEAAHAYREWLERFGPDATVCFNLANALYAAGQPAAAVERFRQAVEIDPDYAEAWSNLGSVLAETGKPEEAVRAFQQALRANPSYGNALYNLADTLEDLGRRDEARRYWQAYLRVDAGSPWADYARTRLAP